MSSSERDEMAREIFFADNWRAAEPATEWEAAFEQVREHAYKIADALIAAGYWKPRTVKTQADLDALPNGSVIRDPEGWVFQRSDYDKPGTPWYRPGVVSGRPSSYIFLPAVAIDEPADD